jgi:hypothetical protein
MATPRYRVITDNDYAGDPDGLFQLVHLLLSPGVEVSAVIGSHLPAVDGFDPGTTTADAGCERVREALDLLGLGGVVEVHAGSNTALWDRAIPYPSAGARAIVAEAMRDDTTLPLFAVFGGGLTELASAWLLEPRIAGRMTAVWIGGPEYPGAPAAPPRAMHPEYNMGIDVRAAQVVFNDSAIPLWQVPRDAYRQVIASRAELEEALLPTGALGYWLMASLLRVERLVESGGGTIGETYVLGDSPLVLLTALQSHFEADPSSSRYQVFPAPQIENDGSYRHGRPGRPIRVYTQLDTRLVLADLYAKLARFARARPV